VGVVLTIPCEEVSLALLRAPGEGAYPHGAVDLINIRMEGLVVTLLEVRLNPTSSNTLPHEHQHGEWGCDVPRATFDAEKLVRVGLVSQGDLR
jgi:hypothetical protein